MRIVILVVHLPISDCNLANQEGEEGGYVSIFSLYQISFCVVLGGTGGHGLASLGPPMLQIPIVREGVVNQWGNWLPSAFLGAGLASKGVGASMNLPVWAPQNWSPHTRRYGAVSAYGLPHLPLSRLLRDRLSPPKFPLPVRCHADLRARRRGHAMPMPAQACERSRVKASE